MDTATNNEISDAAAMILAVLFTIVIMASVIIPIMIIK